MNRNPHFPLALGLTLLALCACGDGHNRINGSVTFRHGDPAEDISTVNGTIHVDASAQAGDVKTVNGTIKMGDHARATSLRTVNGGVSLGRGAEVSGDTHTVNGSISLAATARIAGAIDAVNGTVTLAEGAELMGPLRNVNGSITLTAAHVGGGIETVNGDILIGAHSRVEGGILMKKDKGVTFRKRVPRVVIGPEAVIQGTLRFERDVQLYVSDSATIGTVEGAKAQRFTGDAPPG